jgi:hypothetical protein
MPLAAMLTTEAIYNAFLGTYEDFKPSSTSTALRETRSAAQWRWQIYLSFGKK